MNTSPSRALPVSRYQAFLVLLAVVFVGLTLIVLWQFSITPTSSLATRLQTFPLQIGAWQGSEEPIQQEVITALQVHDWMLRLYRQSPDVFVWLYVGYYSDRNTFAAYHSPLACYPAQGWELVRNDFQSIPIPGAEPITVQKLVVQKGQQQRLILYWHQWGEKVITEQHDWQGHWSQLIDEYRSKFVAILRREALRADRALVRVSAPIDSSLEATLQREITFIQAAFPLLVQHFVPDVPVSGG